jgi:hypothetical protein
MLHDSIKGDVSSRWLLLGDLFGFPITLSSIDSLILLFLGQSGGFNAFLSLNRSTLQEIL